MPNRLCSSPRFSPKLIPTGFIAALLWLPATYAWAAPATLDLTRFYRSTPHEKMKPVLGRQTVDGLPFQIGGEAILYGQTQAGQNAGETYREVFDAIPVGRKFDELHLLHATRWPDAEGRPVALIRLNYADGTKAELPILYGGHVRDWQRLPTEEQETLTDRDSKVFWRGPGIASLNSTTRLFKSTLRNPFPAKVVETLDVVSAKNLTAYTLLAATVAERDPKRPVTPPVPSGEPPRKFNARLVIRVVDDATGKPIEGALVDPRNITVGDVGVVASPVYTPASGEVVIRYPRGASNVCVSVKKDGYASEGKCWKAVAPAEHTFRLAAVVRNEQVRAILETARRKYRAAKTYQDRATLRYQTVTKDEDAAPRSTEQTATLAFARPNRVALVTDDASVVCDGTHLWQSVSRLGQYVESDAPGTLERRHLQTASTFPWISTHPVALLLARPDADFEQLFPSVRELSRAVAETRNGQAGHRVFGTLSVGDTNAPAPVVSFWFNDATGLLGEARVDFTDYYRHSLKNSPMYDEENKPPQIEKAEAVLSLDDIVLDADIPAEQFVFKPANDMKKVAEFDRGGSDEARQRELIGRPAPDISGKDFAGEPLSLAALRGRVVMLDFWAMWCGPCVQAIPSVQKLAEKFADKPVTILGINLDSEGSSEKLTKFLELKKVSIRQFLDPAGKVSKKYRVNGIPCTVLIGTNGIIQAIEVGSRGEESLAGQIERLLKGETLFDPKELADRPHDGEQDTVEPSATETNVALEELAGESFLEQPALAGQFIGAGYQARWLDLDGSGRPQLVLPEWGRGLAIVSADGTQLKRIRLKGLSEGNLSSFEPVRVDGKFYWLVTVSSWTRDVGSGQPASVRFYDADGELLWSYRPEIGEGLSCDMKARAGDLFGDGKTEFVVGIQTYRLRKTGANTYRHEQSRAYLAVLDISGKLLSRHRIGDSVEFIHVAAAAPDQPATVLCISNGKLRRFQIKPPGTEHARAADR